MDVLAQASNVVAQAEATSGRVTLVLDVDDPAQRAAYAAALAVLQINGLDPLAFTEVGRADLDGEGLPRKTPLATREGALSVEPRLRAAPAGVPAAAPASAGSGDDTAANDSADATIKRSYSEALSELTPDEARAQQIVRETFPRVRELLRDGANVEAVAQIQYRRWTEEHLDTSRN
jgi:hypothetical protein